MRRRLVWIACLGFLLGCSDWPFIPSAVQVQTDRRAYTDTSTLLVTVKLFGGAAVALDGCPPPFITFDDSTGGSIPWSLARPSASFACTLNVSRIHLEPGDSMTVAIPLTGFAPGTYRADVLYGPSSQRSDWVAVSKSFEVH